MLALKKSYKVAFVVTRLLPLVGCKNMILMKVFRCVKKLLKVGMVAIKQNRTILIEDF
jgi:hypothetical protein